jgi:hypothetical protein
MAKSVPPNHCRTLGCSINDNIRSLPLFASPVRFLGLTVDWGPAIDWSIILRRLAILSIDAWFDIRVLRGVTR